MLRTAIIFAALFLMPQAAGAATPIEDKPAWALCARALKAINTLADFTRTDCAPTRDANGVTLIFISIDRVFADERSKKAYLMVLVGAVGNELNANPKVPIAAVSFMDKHLGLQKAYFTIPAKDAARLQKEIKADRLTLDSFYSGILAAGKLQSVSK